MTDKIEQPDPPLSPEEVAVVASLSKDFLRKADCVLLSHARSSWRKVSMLVGLAMMDSGLRIEGLPDLFFSLRIRRLVEAGSLESSGNLDCMRFCEVRLPQ